MKNICKNPLKKLSKEPKFYKVGKESIDKQRLK